MRFFFALKKRRTRRHGTPELVTAVAAELQLEEVPGNSLGNDLNGGRVSEGWVSECVFEAAGATREGE